MAECCNCGNVVSLFGRTKIGDGTYLCDDCMSFVHKDMKDVVISTYDAEKYKNLKRYMDEIEEYRNIFEETHSYGNLIIDGKHGLFYIDKGLFSSISKSMIYNMAFLDSYGFEIVPREYKKGLLAGGKVIGDVTFTFVSLYPFMVDIAVIQPDVKTNATESGLFKKTVAYELPKEVKDFSKTFAMAKIRALENLRNKEI